MRYQYKLGGLFEDIIEGVVRGGKDIYDKEKERRTKDEEETKKKKEAADKGAKKPETLLDKITSPVKDAAKKQASADIAKWAMIGIGIWLLLKRR